MTSVNWLELALSVLRFAAPLILAAMGGLFSERSGVIQIALEGFMLMGAFSAAACAFLTNSGLVGLVGAVGVGVFVGLFYGVLVIKFRCDQIVSGTVMNMLAWGGIPVVCKSLFGSTASTPALEMSGRLPSWVPIVLATIIVLFVVGFLSRSALGLWLTFAGEKPEALRSVGVSPENVRWFALMCAGVFASLGGATLSICLSSSYSRNMTAGRGFMALAALILGKWRALPAFMGCLMFGVCEVLQLKLQGQEIPFLGAVPVQIVQVVPYGLTLLLLAGVVGESRAPGKLGDVSS